MEAARSRLPRPWHDAERRSGLGLHGRMSAASLLWCFCAQNWTLHLRAQLMSGVLFSCRVFASTTRSETVGDTDPGTHLIVTASKLVGVWHNPCRLSPGGQLAFPFRSSTTIAEVTQPAPQDHSRTALPMHRQAGPVSRTLNAIEDRTRC